MDNLRLYLGLIGIIFASILGISLILSIKNDKANLIPFYILLVLGVLPQAVYSIPEQIRKPFLIGGLIFAALLSFFTAQYYTKKGKHSISRLFTAVAIITGTLGLLCVFGLIP